jgi:hypothetical protein
MNPFVLKNLRAGMEPAVHEGMKKLNLFTLFLILLWSAGLNADDQKPKISLSERIIVESVLFADEGEIKISQSLRDEAQKLVGLKFSEKAVNGFTDKIRKELKGYSVTVNVTLEPGEKSDRVKLKFEIQAVAKANVNERYVVEGVAFSGIDENKISKALRDEAQKMVGEKYSQEDAHNLAQKLRDELGEHKVDVKVERGEKADCVKVVYRIERIRGSWVTANPFLVYHSKQAFSGSLEIPIDIHHNVFTFGMVNDSDELLERNSGFRFRYEHRKVGTDLVHVRIDFDTYHQKFNPATEAALVLRPDVPGIYRTRQNLAPSLSVYPTRDLMLSAGVSLQQIQIQYPEIHTLQAYAGTADVQFRRKAESRSGYVQNFRSLYSLRTATKVLDSDFVYTRHFVKADYSLSKGRNLFGAHFLGGYITGTAPLFERFSLGNSNTLRGWNKFDVAPLGGSRAAHGSLDYRYRQLEIFYDVGTVWDSKQYSKVRHGLGFGWAYKNRIFASLAFPIRLHDVAPVFMMGFRMEAQ